MFKNILHLTRLEWQKFSKNTVVVLLVAIYALFAPFVLFTAKEVFADAPPPFPNVLSFFEFPLVWDYQGYVSSWFVSFNLGFIAIYIFTSEVSQRTMRQNIITGLTKAEFLLSKFITITLLSLFSTAIYYISCIIIGLMHTPGADFSLIFDNNYSGIKHFIMCMGYMSFALLLAVLIRKGMLVILLYFTYVNMLEPILRQVQLYFFKSRSMIFWPMNTLEDLFPLPLYRLPSTWIENAFGFKPLQTLFESITFSFVYCVIFITISWLWYRKKDI